jgi:PTS system nitrogen regulatory IIA component
MESKLFDDMIFLRLRGRDKMTIINEMLDRLYESGKLQDRQAAYNAVIAREEKMSTGMKNGIAVPHGKTNTVDKLIGCLGVSENPVEFDSLDGQPCSIFIMTISREDQTGPHLQFIAEISGLIKNNEKRMGILAAATPDEALRILTS